MKTSEKSSKPDASRQKKQLIALGGLSAVFAAVLAIQFGGGESAPEAAALTAPAAGDPAAGAVEAPAVAAEPEATPIPVAKDNPVLAATSAEPTLKRSPFSNFWNVAPTGIKGAVASSAPTVTLNATMPGEDSGLAVIDGQLRFVGDSIQGWSLDSVSARSVTLRAPTGEQLLVSMPLLVGKIDLHEAMSAALAPAGTAGEGMPAPSDG